jgi:hypothetical protein
LEADDWDVTVQNAMRSRLTEVIDDGSLMLRAGQQEQKFEVVDRMSDAQAERVFQTLRTLGLELPPETMPSFETCRNCSISANDCTMRVDEPSREVKTDAF